MIFSKDYQILLNKALIHDTTKQYLIKTMLISSFLGLFISMMFMFVILLKGGSFLLVFYVFFTIFIVTFVFLYYIPYISFKVMRAKIDSDLVYTVRHLLLKLQTGESLLNALDSSSRTNTISGRYIARIVNSVEMGISIEEAVRQTQKYSPSDKFDMIMNHILNSFKTGIDLTKSLDVSLEELIQDKILEIKDYGKRLSPITMFYMILGTIVPALGSAIIVIGLTFFEMPTGTVYMIFVVLGCFLVIIQVFFYIVFSSSKPMTGI
jgi:ABC-type multidrug transport system fused ATPase/permease subunit